MKKLVRSVENRSPVPLNVGDFAVPFYLSPNQKAELFISEISESKSDAEVVSEKPESNWFERGELPPVGELCEFRIALSKEYSKCTFVGINSNKNFVIEVYGKYSSYHESKIEFRQIRTDREKFIEQAWGKLRGDTPHKETTELLGQLYDLGYRLPVAE